MGRPLTSTASSRPYRLRALLYEYGIRQQALCDRIQFGSGVRHGRSMACTTLSTLLTRRTWPVTIRRDDIKRAVAELLAEHGVPEDIAKTAWVIDTSDDAQAASSTSRSDDANANSDVADAAFDIPENEMLSAQAREHFNLSRHPFQDDVQGPQDVYLSRDQRYIRESMYYAAKHSGFLAVVGESGSGKTTLRRDLLDRIRRDNEPIIVIQPQTVDKRTLTAGHICDAIVADMSGEVPKQSLEAKARQIQRILAASSRGGNAHALVIEEAHDLAVSTLKYLKRFWELEDGFKKLLGIVLIGQPELGERLDERRNPDAREVIRRCEVATLKSLNGNLEEYLQLKFKRIGSSLDAIFDADAYDAIRTRLTRRRPGTTEVESQLYPLVVHNVCIRAMNEAAANGLPRVNADQIMRI